MGLREPFPGAARGPQTVQQCVPGREKNEWARAVFPAKQQRPQAERTLNLMSQEPLKSNPPNNGPNKGCGHEEAKLRGLWTPNSENRSSACMHITMANRMQLVCAPAFWAQSSGCAGVRVNSLFSQLPKWVHRYLPLKSCSLCWILEKLMVLNLWSSDNLFTFFSG